MKLPPYDIFPEIKTDSLILRQVQLSDIENILEISFYDGKPAATLMNAREMQIKINKDYENGNSIHWGIAEKNSKEIIGTVGFYRGFGNQTGEIGFVLKKNFRGQGFMIESAGQVIEFGFRHIGLQRIVAITSCQNVGAKKLLEKLNFKKYASNENEIEYELRRPATSESTA